MKTILLTLFFVTFIMFLFSCKNDEPSDNYSNSHWFFNFNGYIDGGEGWDLLKSSVDGKLYVCGAFLHVNNDVNMKNIARLNLTNYTWEQMPGINESFSNFVRCIAQDADGNLYFGGDFSQIAGLPAGRCAKFNPTTQTWTPLRDKNFYIEAEQYGPVSGGTYAIAVVNNYVYIGGGIYNTDSAALRYIRRFNLTTEKWEAVGKGVNARVRAMTVDKNGNLYCGGEFTEAGGTEVNYIAKWDGTNWSALGNGVDDYVLCIDVFNSNVYVGGGFKYIDNYTRSQGVAKWNGTSWEAMQEGIMASWGDTYTVQAIAVDENEKVYIGGFFDKNYSNLDSLNHVAVYADNKWNSLGSGLALSSSQGVMGIFADGLDIYFTGYFTRGYGDPNDKINLALWNETKDFTK